MAKTHRAIVIVVSLLPLTGFLAGTGALAFTMYASSVWFRVEIVARDAAGHAHAIAPTTLAREVTASAVPFLAGADHFRRTYDIGPLRNHLKDVGRLACEVDHAVSVEVTLDEKNGIEGAIRRKTERVTCAK